MSNLGQSGVLRSHPKCWPWSKAPGAHDGTLHFFVLFIKTIFWSGTYLEMLLWSLRVQGTPVWIYSNARSIQIAILFTSVFNTIVYEWYCLIIGIAYWPLLLWSGITAPCYLTSMFWPRIHPGWSVRVPWVSQAPLNKYTNNFTQTINNINCIYQFVRTLLLDCPYWPHHPCFLPPPTNPHPPTCPPTGQGWRGLGWANLVFGLGETRVVGGGRGGCISYT